MTQDLDAIDPTFIADLAASRQAVAKAIQWFQGHGRIVIAPPTFIRPSADERHNYSDWGDLWVGMGWEIRHRHLEFTSVQTYPFDTIDIEMCAAWDHKQPKPSNYLIFNEPMTHALIVNCMRTQRDWRVREHVSRGRLRRTYACPKELITQTVDFSAEGL